MPALSDAQARRPKRVGHKGAHHIAPGNTTASFDAALAAGVDMIEFDVLSEHEDGSGELRLSHDYGDLARHPCPTLAEGLEHLASARFVEVELDVDLKLPGYEERVIDALRAHGLLERSIICSGWRSSLAKLRRYEPGVQLGWSVPRVKRDYTTDLLTRVPALAIATGYKALLPRLAAEAVRAKECDAIMSHWRLVSRSLLRHVRAAGGELYVWTVDDAARIRSLEELGVDGVITNDPRLFSA
jgi:glycerophosphoryl diester phosphodiesterase